MPHEVQYDADAMLEKARAVRQEPPGPLALIEQLGQALDRLETEITRLEEKLAPVTLDQDPAPGLTQVEMTPGRTMLGQRLAHLTAWVERLGNMTMTLNGRVEL